jgi:hypothetical protein
VENDSFLEIRDCYIKSIKDPKVILQEKEHFMSNDLLTGGNGLSSLAPEIEDCCFAINLESLMNPETGIANPPHSHQ